MRYPMIHFYNGNLLIHKLDSGVRNIPLPRVGEWVSMETRMGEVSEVVHEILVPIIHVILKDFKEM